MHKHLTKGFWLIVVASVLVMPVHVLAQPVFTKVFSPDIIGPGSVSTLTFTIDNTASGTPHADLAFTDTLPAGLSIADPSNAVSDCTRVEGTLSAPVGGDTISLEDGEIGGFTTCTVVVDVIGSTVGTHTNISGDLTSDGGNSGTAAADLTVSADRPGFAKAFSPASIPIGSRSTLTFTLDNTLNPSAATHLSFTDKLPLGMEIADPSDASTDCPDSAFHPVTLTAIPGSNTVVFTQQYYTQQETGLGTGTSCTVSVDVVATGSGLLGNSTEDLYSDLYLTISSGKANATLEATSDSISLRKNFIDDPVPPGGNVTLEFTITSYDRESTITDIAFTDDLNSVLTDLAATGLPLNDPCGAGSTLTDTGGVLALSGGTLAPEASCTFSVTLQIPITAAPNAYPTTTSDVTGGGITGNAALDTLFVHPAPLLAKAFTDDPVAAGGDVTLEYSITNTNPDHAATEIAFTDELTTFLPFPVSVVLPAADFCGAGSEMSLDLLGQDRQGIVITNANLAAGGSCTFGVTVAIPADVATGAYTSTTEEITDIVDGTTYTGNRAADNLSVVAGPVLRKSFLDDPVSAGDTVTLEYTLEHGAEAPGSAVDIAFTDDLTSALAGLAAIGLPLNDPCGVGSTLVGTDLLELSGGSLDPGDTCTFSVTLQIPADAIPNNIQVGYTSTTSDVTSTVSGIEDVTSPGALDDLIIASIYFTAEFTDDPVIPGDTATLRFTLDNVSDHDATSMTYTYDLNRILSGLSAIAPLPIEPCGVGSSLVATPLLIFTEGNLTANTDDADTDECTFEVTVQVPGGSNSGTYTSTSSNLTATLNGNAVIVPPAADVLTVQTEWLALTKAFTEDSVIPGNTAEMTFTLTNLHSVEATNITFTDDLENVLSGLVAEGPPLNDMCSDGSSLAFDDVTGVLTFSGGSLDAEASCEFTVTLSIPADTSPVTLINTTSGVTGEIDGLPVTGSPAIDEMRVESVKFSETFKQLGPTPAGEIVTLSVTIANMDAALPVSGIAFANDLDNTLTGLVAKGLPLDDICGSGSVLSGTSFLTFSEGSLAAAASCTFDIQLLIPDTAAAGDYVNTTSDLTSNGIVVSSAASATMEVDPAQGSDGGSSGLCFINAFDTPIVIPYEWITGFVVIMISLIGTIQSRRNNKLF